MNDDGGIEYFQTFGQFEYLEDELEQLLKAEHGQENRTRFASDAIFGSSNLKVTERYESAKRLPGFGES